MEELKLIYLNSFVTAWLSTIKWFFSLANKTESKACLGWKGGTRPTHSSKMESQFSMLFVLVSPKGFSERELGVQATLLGSHLDRETWGTRRLLFPELNASSVYSRKEIESTCILGRQTGSCFVFVSLSWAVLGSLPRQRVVEVIAALQKTVQTFCNFISLPL